PTSSLAFGRPRGSRPSEGAFASRYDMRCRTQLRSPPPRRFPRPQPNPRAFSFGRAQAAGRPGRPDSVQTDWALSRELSTGTAHAPEAQGPLGGVLRQRLVELAVLPGPAH